MHRDMIRAAGAIPRDLLMCDEGVMGVQKIAVPIRRFVITSDRPAVWAGPLRFHLIANIIVKEKGHFSRQTIYIKMMFLFLFSLHALMFIESIVAAGISKQVEVLYVLRAHIIDSFLE